VSPRRGLPARYGAESAIFRLLALLVGHFRLILVLALAIGDGLAWMAARPLSRATSAAVTAPAGLLREGNAVLNGSFSISLLLGPALAGAVVASGGTQAALLINVGLFLLMAVALVTAELPMPVQSEGSSRRRVRAAAAYVRAHRPVRVLIVMQAVAVMFFTITIPVEVVYAQHSLHAGAAGYGLLLSAWGGGAVVGSLAYARWRSAETRPLVVLSAASIALGMAAMAAAPDLGVALVGARSHLAEASTRLAVAVGYPGSSVAFAQLLSGMERSGLIEREVRGKRTYRIRLGPVTIAGPGGLGGAGGLGHRRDAPLPLRGGGRLWAPVPPPARADAPLCAPDRREPGRSRRASKSPGSVPAAANGSDRRTARPARHRARAARRASACPRGGRSRGRGRC